MVSIWKITAINTLKGQNVKYLFPLQFFEKKDIHKLPKLEISGQVYATIRWC